MQNLRKNQSIRKKVVVVVVVEEEEQGEDTLAEIARREINAAIRYSVASYISRAGNSAPGPGGVPPSGAP